MKNIINKTLNISSLNHWYGHGEMKRHVLQSISMEISPGEVVLLTGPSGCGKTTLLTLIGALRALYENPFKRSAPIWTFCSAVRHLSLIHI